MRETLFCLGFMFIAFIVNEIVFYSFDLLVSLPLGKVNSHSDASEVKSHKSILAENRRIAFAGFALVLTNRTTVETKNFVGTGSQQKCVVCMID